MKRIYTIGHSTHDLEDFIKMLECFSVNHVVDIRHYPGSRRFPHFNKDALSASLPAKGVAYTHLIELGGRRKPAPDSLNKAWRLAAFRGYADHMETEEFEKGIGKLISIARSSETAYMCSEAVWWSCHRALVSDYLKWKGWEVLHILNPAKAEEHPYTRAAAIINGELNYTQVK